MAFPPIGKFWSYYCLSLHWLSNKLKIGCPVSSRGFNYSRADWGGLCDHLRDIPWENNFKLSAFAAASEFCEWVQVGIDVYIPYRKYQVKPDSYHGFQHFVVLP